MGKSEKRKTRLNKTGGGGEFIGFGAFTTPNSGSEDVSSTQASSSSSSLPPASMSTSTTSTTTSAPTITLSPVYTGKDSQLTVLFPRIGQKRDATTKTKALQELTEYFVAGGGGSAGDGAAVGDSKKVIPPKKKIIVDALCHLLYLYHSKLYYDTNSSVRAAALMCLQQAQALVPKAWHTLTTEQQPELLGMIYCAQADPAANEVRTAATVLCQSLLQTSSLSSDDDDDDDNDNKVLLQERTQAFSKGIWFYVRRIVSYGRPIVLYEALFARHKSSNSSNNNSSSKDGGGAKKNSKGSSDKSSSSTTTGGGGGTRSEAQTDQIEERYERIVGAAIEGLQMWIRHHYNTTSNLRLLTASSSSPSNQDGDGNNDNDKNDDSIQYYEETIRMVWKNMGSPKPSLRRKTYALVGACCQSKQQETRSSSEESSSSETNLSMPLPSLIDPQKVGTLLAQNLSTEKEPVNQATILETLLAFLAFLPKDQRHDTFQKLFSKPLKKQLKRACHGASASQWAPTLLPLIAIVAPQPTPATNHDGVDIELQLSLLTSAWEGQTTMKATADLLEVAAAIAESSTFVLLKQASAPSSTDQDQKAVADDAKITETMKSVAQRWLDALGVYLSTTPTGVAQRVHKRLGKALARDLIQLDQASHREATSMAHIKDWFWGPTAIHKILNIVEHADNKAASVHDNNLASWLMELQSRRAEQQQTLETTRAAEVVSVPESSYVAPVLRDKFHFQLATYQGASGLVPTLDTYLLWIAIFRFVGVDQLFREEEPQDEPSTTTAATSVDKFIMNDVLRWMIIHTSSLSEHADAQLAKQDFTLFQLCEARPTTGSLWESVLRELVAAKCDLAMLNAGLAILLKDGLKVEDIQCRTLQNLAIQVAQEAVVSTDHHVGEDDSEEVEVILEEYRKTADFLQLCVGLGHLKTRGMLVDKEVIDSWVECACAVADDDFKSHFYSMHGSNPVLETLVCFVREIIIVGETGKDADLLSEKQIYRVILESWRQGGDLWRDTTVRLLEVDPNLRSTIVQLACEELHAILTMVDVDAAEVSLVWAERAARILKLCRSSTSSKLGNQEGIPFPSLKLLGLADLQSWRVWTGESGKRSSTLAQCCLMNLMEQIHITADRLELFQNTEGVDTAELVITILMALSGANDDVLCAASVRRRDDDCAGLLKALGGKDALGFALLDCWCRKAVDMLTDSMSGDDSGRQLIGRGIAVLSQLVELLFLRVLPAPSGNLPTSFAEDMLEAAKLQEGDTVWYISKVDRPAEREKVQIVKVHRDVPTDLYFTIRLLERDEQEPERQTVVDRLRREACPSGKATNEIAGTKEEIDGTTIEDISGDERAKRQELVQVILQKLVRPFFEQWQLVEVELLSIVVSQCGLLGQRGLGSVHYEVFRLLNSIQAQLKAMFDSSENEDLIAAMLWKLTLALGYGCNTPSSSWNIALLGFDPTDSVSAIVQHYNDGGAVSKVELDRSVAAWLAVSASALPHGELRDQAMSLLFQSAVRLFQASHGDESGFHLNDFVALRAISSAQLGSHQVDPGESMVQEDEAEALAGLVKAFGSKWENSGSSVLSHSEDGSPVWRSLPYFRSIVDASLNRRPALVGAAVRRCPNDVVRAMFFESKRWHCLRFLHAFASAGIPLLNDSESAINSVTARRLVAWCDGLTEQESEELEDDVGVAAQWLPDQLMNEIESWSDGDVENDTVNDVASTNQMVSWLALLRIIDVAASKDSVNRPSLTSYINKCQAVGTVLNTALAYASIGNDRKTKVDGLIDSEEIWNDEEALELTKLASLVVFRTVEVFPALAKHWWETECPKYFTQPVREFVETRVAPEILRRELERISQTASFGDMTVKGSTVSREVTALYIQDDFTLTVVISLPLSFPFRSAEVDCSKTLGVPQKRWKRWSLQITQMLNNQGGTLQDALMLWKENVDKEFEGIEPCPVCYSVLHVKTHKLPEMECKTCQNRFHFDCLTQWFKSSGKSACVLCQQPWSGSRVS